jgi:hypothetical protein
MAPLPLENLWVVLPVWTILPISDYYLTLRQARICDRAVKHVIVLWVGVELTLQFRHDTQQERRISPRFIVSLLLILTWIGLVWYLCLKAMWLPELYRAFAGGLLVLQLVIHLRNFRNLSLFRSIERKGESTGHMVFSRRVLLRNSAAKLDATTVFLLLGFVVTGAWELLGGAVLFATVGAQHAVLGRKASAFVSTE